MAWNEPGKGQDPWGGGNGNGPPDLDEVWRRLRERLTGNRGGASSGGGKGAPSLGGKPLLLIIAAIIVIWLLTGFYIIGPGEQGVVLQFGSYERSTGPGPHWHIPYPVQSVEKVDMQRVRAISDHAVMLTKDENIVDVKVSMQYRVNDASDYLFNLRFPNLTAREVLKSAVREVVGASRMNQVIQKGVVDKVLQNNSLEQIAPKVVATEQPAEKVKQPPLEGSKETIKRVHEEQAQYPEITKRSRAMLPQNINKILQYNLNSYQSGLKVTSINVQYAQPPEQVQSAFEKAIEAREQRQQLKNEATAEALSVLNNAKGEAQALLNKAKGYRSRVVQRASGDASRFTQLLKQYQKAPVVTRKRMYLDTMQTVLQNTSKIVVDSGKHGNQLIYLPLDKLMQQHKGSSSDNSVSGSAASISSLSSGTGGSTSGQSVNPLRSRSR